MSHVSLAARYRPQTFAELIGQETVCSILSRASAEDRIAPAYLFSGTRGVGKTTLARVFAKALNCEKAPTAEPCNVCDQCRKITQGVHVDVPEIDGASNRGIEDARRLREHIGYAPLEAHRKVFIIDEAHMLTRESFNALLKTLEEPPPRVTFILATTEAHKFPITIVSRCQHFLFKRLPEERIAAHLRRILEREQVRHEEGAVRLLARRAAGSVRDAVSLLDQTLALGGESLNEQSVGRVLGLAGRDFFSALLDRTAAGDCAAVSALAGTLQDQGVDIGFFLRELAALWRNLFLLRQSGDEALPILEMPEEEGGMLLDKARVFSLPHIHAAWQMTLDAQRRVIHSLEPACALELLLLNLAVLPRLVPVEHTPTPEATSAFDHVARLPEALASASSADNPSAAEFEKKDCAGCCPPQSRKKKHVAPETVEPASPCEELRTEETPRNVPAPAERALAQSDNAAEQEPPPDWTQFLAFCGERRDAFPLLPLLRQMAGRFEGRRLLIAAATQIQYRQLNRGEAREALLTLLREYGGDDLRLDPPTASAKSKAELKAEFAAHPLLQPLIEQFDARIVHCAPLSDSPSANVAHEEKKV